MDEMDWPSGLPGRRFHPTDQELIIYLNHKLLGTNPDVDRVISEVHFNNFEPWELPDKSKIKDDRMWFFFCRRDYQNTNSKRVKRTTKTGFWKITSQEREIKDQVTKACIGKKKTLVFHRRSAGSDRGERTDWIMHEYFVESDQSPYVICRLKNKGNDMADTLDGNGGEPRGNNITEVENPVALDPNPSAQTTNPALGAEGFDDRFVLSNKEVSELQSGPLYSPPRYGFLGDEISVRPSVKTFPCCMEERRKKAFFPRMITSLKRCFNFCFYSRTSSDKNSTVG